MATTKSSRIPPGAIAATASFLGPLTTTFSAASTCSTGNTYSLGEDATAVIWQVGPTKSDDGCLPSKWAVNGYYSPAICPYGYTDACSMTQSNVETTICCPANLDFSCYSGVAYNKFGCSYSASTIDLTSLIIDYGETTWATYTDITITTQPIWAWSVQVQKAVSGASAPIPTSSDNFLSEVSTTATTTLSTGSNIGSSTGPDTAPSMTLGTVPAAQTGSESTSPASTLAGGAIAGIVVGVLGALALGITGTFLFMRRRKAQKTSPSHPNGSCSTQSHRPIQILYADQKEVYELGTKSIHEMDAQRDPSEMPSWTEHHHRLPSTSKTWELPA
ncbi:hypothetical protein F4804DRAFT_105152 [Jackrogersella minutella]|nr:hypothetical protein F4804DRAFT_105152 [Jackrogersella minutella]